MGGVEDGVAVAVDHDVLPFIGPEVSEMVQAALLVSVWATLVTKRGAVMEALLIKIPRLRLDWA
jgi:hypothetical protein